MLKLKNKNTYCAVSVSVCKQRPQRLLSFVRSILPRKLLLSRLYMGIQMEVCVVTGLYSSCAGQTF